MAVLLTILRGPKSGNTYEFDEDIITIGSGRNNTLIIRDNDVSVTHCQLMRIDTDYDIEDMGARFGTFVNGQELSPGDKWLLSSGSIIELGSQITIEYRLKSDEIDATATQPVFMDQSDPGSQPCLVLVEEGNIQEAYLLQSHDITLGRSVGNDIKIANADISRTHVRLIWREKQYFLKDMDSRNGTFLNGVPVTAEMPLAHSDVIRMGSSTQLHFVFRSDLPDEWDPVTPDGTSHPHRETSPDNTIPFALPHRDGTHDLGNNYDEGDLDDHILVAYAREDWEDIVAPIVLNLGDAKQKVWVEQHLRPNGDGWRKAVEQAQLECWLLVVVVSPRALEKSYVKDIYRYFFNREKPIILVEYEPVPKLPFQLSKVVRLKYDKESPGAMFRRLVFEIMQLKPRYADHGDS